MWINVQQFVIINGNIQVWQNIDKFPASSFLMNINTGSYIQWCFYCATNFTVSSDIFLRLVVHLSWSLVDWIMYWQATDMERSIPFLRVSFSTWLLVPNKIHFNNVWSIGGFSKSLNVPVKTHWCRSSISYLGLSLYNLSRYLVFGLLMNYVLFLFVLFL